MQQIKRILQLKIEGRSARGISRLMHISRPTVTEYLNRLERIGSPPEELLKLNDSELSSLFYAEPDPTKLPIRQKVFLERVENWLTELTKTGVTRHLLWEEYCLKNPTGYGYTQFCHYLSKYQDKKGCVMHFDYKPGEKMMVDFASEALRMVDKETGEELRCQVFVAVLPYSGYTYVEAVKSQKQEDFISCLVNALTYFEGVPQCILSDNLKSAVKRANRYEPTFTALAEQFGFHYNTTLMATRVAKPKDKPHVESTVRTVYTRIYAPLRHRNFFCLQELNAAIMEQLAIHNTLPFQRKEHCRKELFLTQEKPLLKPLPEKDFEVKQTVEAKVQKNYHVILGQDWHSYSVPYEYVGEYVKIIYTRDQIEIYLHLKRIAIHPRNPSRNGYSTLEEHMPPNHQYYQKIKGWNENDFKRLAQQIGTNTLVVIEKVLSSRMFHEQTYNSCLGIIRLGKKYGNQRLEAACSRVSNIPSVSYRILNNILINNMDQKTDKSVSFFSKVVEHENIRGALTYQ